jgi:phosphomannomutase/phosphoglucomutase
VQLKAISRRGIGIALAMGKLKRRLKAVVAAGNGTAGRFAPEVLRQAGCEVVEVDCTADWDFKKHNPNPENLKFLHSMQDAILESKADLGIGIDGDGDRIGVVDDKGREIYSDRLGLLLARWICPRYPGRSLVVDVKSTGLFFTDPVLAAQRPT